MVFLVITIVYFTKCPYISEGNRDVSFRQLNRTML